MGLFRRTGLFYDLTDHILRSRKVGDVIHFGADDGNESVEFAAKTDQLTAFFKEHLSPPAVQTAFEKAADTERRAKGNLGIKCKAEANKLRKSCEGKPDSGFKASLLALATAFEKAASWCEEEEEENDVLGDLD